MRKAKSRKAKKRRGLLHHSLDRQRLGRETWGIERAFADGWENENKPYPGINYGWGTLQDLMVRQRIPYALSGERIPFWITQRVAVIVATVIQWLGTNCGFAFLDNVLRKCGHTIIKIPPKPKKVEEKIVKRVIRFLERR